MSSVQKNDGSSLMQLCGNVGKTLVKYDNSPSSEETVIEVTICMLEMIKYKVNTAITAHKNPLTNEFVRRLQSSIGHLSFKKRTIRHFMSIFELFIVRMRERID